MNEPSYSIHNIRKKYLFVTMDGLGFLYPAIRLAHILQGNSQEVLFISPYEHSLTLTNNGIRHLGIGNGDCNFLDLHRWGNPGNAITALNTLEKIIAKYRPDVIVASPLALIAFVIAEKYEIPLINVGFCRYLFPDGFHEDIARTYFLNALTDCYNAYRLEIGLPSIETIAIQSPLIGTKYLLRSVPEFDDEIILPKQVACLGDLYFEPGYINKPLFQFIAASKARGRTVVYVQIGRLFKKKDIWERLLKVLGHLPIDFVMDIGRADYIAQPSKMPTNFFTSHFVPIGAISGQIDFVICSGHTTSVISAIVHGKQILSIPTSIEATELTKQLETKKLAFAIYNIEGINVDNIHNIFHQLNNKLLLPSILKYQKLFSAYTDDVIYDIVKSV